MPVIESPPPAAARRHPLLSLFEEAGDELLGTAYHFVGNRDDAVEVYQEAFLKCWRRRDGLGQIVDLRAWVFRVLVNTARDLLRRRVRRPAVPLTVEVAGPPAGDEGRLETEELVERLREAIGHLPEEQRQVFVLRQNGGLPYAEIADLLGIPEGTAKTRMRRALARLRKHFEGDGR